LLVLEFDGRIGFAADVVGRLHICGEPLVVDEVGRGCVGEVGESRLEPGYQIEMGYPVARCGHENSVRCGHLVACPCELAVVDIG